MNPKIGRGTRALFSLLVVSLFGVLGTEARAFDGFIENRGQFPAEIRYVAFDGPYRIYLLPDALVVAYRPGLATNGDPGKSALSLRSRRASTVDRAQPKDRVAYFQLVGAEPRSSGSLAGRGRLPTAFNFFFGNDPARWASSVPAFGRVAYGFSASDSLELSYGNGALTYRARASSDLHLVYDAARSTLAVTASDGLQADAAAADGLLIHAAPQPGSDSGRIVLGRDLSVRVPAATPQKRGTAATSLVWSTFVGGTGRDYPAQVLLTASGDIVFVGFSDSMDFPVPDGFGQFMNGNDDCVLGKLSGDGSQLLWATYVGGSGFDWAWSACILPDSTIAFTGGTYSGDFPLRAPAGAEAREGAKAPDLENVFVARLSSDGGTLMASTLVGGSDDDEALRIVAAGESSVVFSGLTLSSNFPTTSGAFSRQFVCCTTAFVASYDFQQAGLNWSTFLGGGGVHALALDRAGNVVVGGVAGQDFPVTQDAYDTSFNGTADVFVSKLDPTGSTLLWATFLGGEDWEAATSLALDDSGDVYVAGSTSSAGFPTTPWAIATTYRGGVNDCFLSRLSRDGQRLVWSTYLGGSGQDAPWGDATAGPSLAVRGNSLIASGQTISPNFPVTADALDGQHHGSWDVFLDVFDRKMGELTYGTFFGNTSADFATNMTVGAHGDVVVTGMATTLVAGEDYPTTAGAFDTTRSAAGDFFLTKFSSPVVPVYMTSLVAQWCGAGDACLSWAVTDCGRARSFRVWALGAVGGLTLAADIPATDRCEFTWRDTEAGERLGYALEMLDGQGGSTWFGPVSLAPQDVVSAFAAISPNPSRDSVRIEFGLARAQRVRLSVFDLRGRLVATLLDGELPAKAHAVNWNGRGSDGARAPAGTYLVRLQAEGWRQCRRVVVVR